MAESSERDSGVCVGMAVVPAPCGAGLRGQCVCTALCQPCAQRCLDCPGPAPAVGACKAFQHFPAQQPALGKQERALGSADGPVSFLRYFLRVGSGGGLRQSLRVAVPLAAFLRVQGHRPAPPSPSLPALSPSIWPVSKGWLTPGVWDIVCNSLGLIHARWFYWQP